MDAGSSAVDVRGLAERLGREGEVVVTDAERRAVVGALEELARSAVVRAKHEALLKSYGEDAGEVERLAVKGLMVARDHAGAREGEQRGATDELIEARARLATEVRRSGDARGIITAAVRFAASLVMPG